MWYLSDAKAGYLLAIVRERVGDQTALPPGYEAVASADYEVVEGGQQMPELSSIKCSSSEVIVAFRGDQNLVFRLASKSSAAFSVSRVASRSVSAALTLQPRQFLSDKVASLYAAADLRAVDTGVRSLVDCPSWLAVDNYAAVNGVGVVPCVDPFEFATGWTVDSETYFENGFLAKFPQTEGESLQPGVGWFVEDVYNGVGRSVAVWLRGWLRHVNLTRPGAAIAIAAAKRGSAPHSLLAAYSYDAYVEWFNHELDRSVRKQAGYGQLFYLSQAPRPRGSVTWKPGRPSSRVWTNSIPGNSDFFVEFGAPAVDYDVPQVSLSGRGVVVRLSGLQPGEILSVSKGTQ